MLSARPQLCTHSRRASRAPASVASWHSLRASWHSLRFFNLYNKSLPKTRLNGVKSIFSNNLESFSLCFLFEKNRFQRALK